MNNIFNNQIKKYVLKKARKKYENGKIANFSFICKPNIPDFYSSLYISNKSKNYRTSTLIRDGIGA